MSVVSDRTPNPGAAQQPAPLQFKHSPARRLLKRWNDAELFLAPARDEWPLALRRLRTIGFWLLGVQLVIWGWWSAHMASRSALTWDYSLYNQAVYLIAHGHLNPYSSTFGYPFWQNDGEFIFWPIAVFERIWPHLVTLKLVQDLAIAASEAIAFVWMCEIAARWNDRERDVPLAVALAGLGLVMLVADPWLTMTISFDAHAEPFVVPFMIAAARAFYRGRRSGWLWIGLVIAGGAVPATYAGALGLTLAFSGRRWWRAGLFIAVVAFGWETVLHSLNAAHGAGVGQLYRQIIAGPNAAPIPSATTGTLVKAMIEHPGRVASALWSNKTDLWAVIAPVGVIGVFWPPALIPAIVVLAEGDLTPDYVFSYPGFQNAVLVPLIAVGTVALCAAFATRVRHRRAWLPWLVCGVLAANALIWAAIWIPQAGNSWVRVPSKSAAVLSALRARIGPGDEVVGQQGIVGAFSDRAHVYSMLTPDTTVPVKAHKVWIILAPEVGVETASISGILSDVRALSANRSMHLFGGRDGVWGFEWTAPAGARQLTIGKRGYGYLPSQGSNAFKVAQGLEKVTRTDDTVSAWTVVGRVGRVVRVGPSSQWYATNNGEPGYVIAQAYWQEPPGSYTAMVSLKASAKTNVEVWDATSSTLLGRKVLTNTHGRTSVTLHVSFANLTKQKLFGGWGIWATVPHQPVAADDLEIRVFTAGAPHRVSVYTAQIR